MDHTLLAGKRVLVVDDSTTIRLLLRSLLSERGATVSEVATGQEALALPSTDYDLIILDLLLPDTNGMQVLHEIRQSNDESAIVMLTGVGGIKSAIAAVQENADGYIEKHDLTACSDFAEFFYALEQGMQHRKGLTAQKQLQQIKADFYSMVTHDLRNPASAISFALDALQQDRAGAMTADQRELVCLASSSAVKLNRLINDYLDFAKMDAGFMALEPCRADLRPVLEAAVQATILQARAKGHTVTLDVPPHPVYVTADIERLSHALDNLLSNAIKYTPANGRISAQLTSDPQMALLRISDDGVGIPPEQIPPLFSKYHRVPGTAARGISGTGLGLLIVREIVVAHNGRVTAQSTGIPGEGSTFTIELPLCCEA